MHTSSAINGKFLAAREKKAGRQKSLKMSIMNKDSNSLKATTRPAMI